MAASTPQTLRQGWYLGWAFSICLMLIAILSAREDRQAIETVGKDTAPSVIAAEHIKSALAAMDANAANELLAPAGHAAQSVRSYEDRRTEASKALIAAAENLTYGDTDRAAIEKIQLALGEYEIRVQQARDYHVAGDPRQESAYLAATTEMDDVLWPAADALDKANLDVLKHTYDSRRSAARLSLAVLVLVGMALIGLLLAMQVFLFRRTNRVLNLPLVACTLLSFAFLTYAERTFTASMQDLKVARQDAFISLHALWRARAVAYRASADESRFLFIRSKSTAFEQDFAAQVDSLAKLPDGVSYEQAADRAIAGKKQMDFTGYLADELNNITFEGEADMARATLIAFRYYVSRHAEILRLDHAGKHQDAIAVAVGSRSGQSNRALEQLDGNLEKTLEINQKAFDQAVQGGFRTLSGFELIALVTCASQCVLLWLGVRPRLKEYEV